MRIGRTTAFCFLSIGAAYFASAFVACGGDTSGGNSGGTATTNTTNTTSTTIVITGGSGGAGGGTTGGTGGSGAGGNVDPDAACVSEPRTGEAIPLDLFFMVDKSGSMTCPVGTAGMNCTNGQMPPPAVNRWTSIKEALVGFANAPSSAGLGAGIGFFPQLNGNQLRCNPQDYATPAAGIAALPGAASAIQTALNGQMPQGSTPTVPALSGAIQYATGYAQSHPGRSTAIVFATDGVPTECDNNNNNIDGAVAVAEAAFRGNPSIRTFVLGVGPRLDNLNQIAVAGGTQKAYLVESGGSTDLINALNEIRKTALSCDYQIPIIPGKVPDPNAVAIRVKIGSTGMEQLVPRVDDVTKCGPNGGGWYFDPPLPDTPKKIVLCPATCDPLLKTMGSSMTVLMGCKIIVPPPD